ncbi:DUF5709 domain-containing protein [Kitasatospora sp. NPDC088346]|uniref:DUF5709 domain-containing protein n=1 Tax=Kitasatospora sp. NPDC088346 TaxID=3364073 RepID=UPI00381F89E7
MAEETDDARGDDVYQPDGSEVTDDTGVLDAEDTLLDRGADPYDEGWSPPERPLAVERFGTTGNEQAEGQTLDRRLAEELPDPALGDLTETTDGLGDASDTDGELVDDEVGDSRAGRLVAPDGRRGGMFASDIGIDGAAASAEEAAVHVVRDGEDRAR